MVSFFYGMCKVGLEPWARITGDDPSSSFKSLTDETRGPHKNLFLWGVGVL